MTRIVKATTNDTTLLSKIGRITLLESHGHSAPAEDIEAYVTAKYNEAAMQEELSDPGNLYHIIYQDGTAAGYSKIVLNTAHENIPQPNVTKLDRIYVLKEFYGTKLGYELLRFNIELSKNNGQAGIWLFTWVENHRAVQFYERAGFTIIGSHDFRVSERRTNLNHQMLLLF